MLCQNAAMKVEMNLIVQTLSVINIKRTDSVRTWPSRSILPFLIISHYLH